MPTAGSWIEMIVFVGGLVASVVLTAKRWRKPVYRLLPFVYATAYAVGVSWYEGKAVSELGIFVLGANIAAGVLLFVLWVESPRRSRG